MTQVSFLNRTERLPVSILPTMVGTATLSNIFNEFGFYAIRNMTMLFATLVLLAYILKLIMYSDTCIKEYKYNTVSCSLYAGFTMLLMVLGSYYSIYVYSFGKALWFIGLLVHMIHICVFTYLNVLKNRVKDTFVPTWFVTYNGIMVSIVVGDVMYEPEFLTVILYYGISIYFILLPVMLWRLCTLSVKPQMFHSLAILLTPCSLCIFSYLNIVQQPNLILACLLYICVLISLVFVIFTLPKFFSYPFSPAFSGLTFPMAIGCVASLKMSDFLESLGYISISNILNQVAGIQIYVTTAIIGFVLINFFMLLVRTPKNHF